MHLPEKLRLPLAATAGTILILGVTQSPAQAHWVQAFHGSDTATVVDGHRGIYADDNECDGNGVYAYAHLTNGSYVTVSDPDGCSSQVGYLYAPTTVDWFYVCEKNVGCSPVKDA